VKKIQSGQGATDFGQLEKAENLLNGTTGNQTRSLVCLHIQSCGM